MKYRRIFFVFMAVVLLAACQPQQVEVTRVVTESVTEIQEVEVTRIVEGEVVTEVQEVEVTRIVEVPVEAEEAAAGEEAAMDDGQKPTLSILLTEEGGYGEVTTDNHLFTAIQEKTGYTFDITQAPFEGYGDKLTTVLAGGDLPDIVELGGGGQWASGRAIADQFGPEGLFVPLDEYIAAGKMPNLEAALEAHENEYATLQITSPDGHIYMAPQFSSFPFIVPGMVSRTDLLDACGIVDKTNPDPAAIQDLDQLYDAVVCMSEQLGGKPVWGNREGFAEFVRKNGLWFGTGSGIYYNPVSGEYDYGPLMDRYRTMVEFQNRLWTEGLLHPDYATMSDEDWSSLFYGTCEAGIALENIGWTIYPCRKIGIDTGIDYYIQSPTIDGERVLWPLPNLVTLRRPMVIAADSENIDDAVAFIDWMYSEEGADTVYYGLEGRDWDVRDDGKTCVLGYIPPDQSKDPAIYCDGNVPESQLYYQPPFGLGSLDFARMMFYQQSDKWSHTSVLPDYPERWSAPMSQFMDSGSMTDPPPPVTLNVEELEIASDLGATVDTYVLEETQNFIEGRRPLTDEEWADFVATVEELGGAQIEELWNAALARFKEQVGE